MSTAKERRDEARLRDEAVRASWEFPPATVFIGTTREDWRAALTRCVERRGQRPSLVFQNHVSDDEVSTMIERIR